MSPTQLVGSIKLIWQSSDAQAIAAPTLKHSPILSSQNLVSLARVLKVGSTELTNQLRAHCVGIRYSGRRSRDEHIDRVMETSATLCVDDLDGSTLVANQASFGSSLLPRVLPGCRGW